MRRFGFDANKSAANLAKHKLDFVAAQALWNDEQLVELPSLKDDEVRWLIIGLIDGKHWAAIVTYRDDVVRIISVRRARKREVDFYESRRSR